VKNCVKQPMAIGMGAGSRLQLDDHLVGLGASEIRLGIRFGGLSAASRLKLSHSITGASCFDDHAVSHR